MTAETKVLIGAAIVCIALIVVGFVGAYYESTRWDRFVRDHNCQVIGYERGGASVGIGADGKVIVVQNANKMTWRCDDEKTYTR